MLQLSPPAIPSWDPNKSDADNWQNITRVLSRFFADVVTRSNASFVRDGTGKLRATEESLSAGTIQVVGDARSDTINAYHDGSVWRSWDTAQPSYRILMDMENDVVRIDRAAATTAALTWVTYDRWPAPLARMRRTSAQNLANNVWTEIVMNQEDEVRGGMTTSVTTGRITVPIAGRYRVSGVLSFAASGGGTYRVVTVAKNGVAYDAPGSFRGVAHPNAGFRSLPVLTDIVNLAAGDTVSLLGLQDSGGPLDVSAQETSMAAEFIGV